jgi:HEAT repeat protein
MPEKKPHELIRDLAAERAKCSDDEVLAEIESIPPLADESDTAWDEPTYWSDFAYRYVALSDVAAERKLRAAVRLLLERACNGDPGEMMRGMRHSFEAIFAPDWRALGDVCMELCASKRAGTRMWATHQLMILDDPRAKPVFERALDDDNAEVRSAAAAGLERLARIA